MNSIRLSLVPAVALAFAVGCTAEVPYAPEGLGPSFRAQVETFFKGWFPLNPPPGGVFDACTGENVLVSGEFNLIVRQVIAASGQSVFRVHVQSSVKGTGATSGIEYVSNEVLNQTETAGPNGAAVFRLLFRTHTISQGGGSNASGVIQIQFTVNANGTITIDKEVFEFDICHG